jgi:hypothetical protein
MVFRFLGYSGALVYLVTKERPEDQCPLSRKSKEVKVPEISGGI